jgi:hypothetical protein
MEVLVVLVAECLVVPLLLGIWLLAEAVLTLIVGGISLLVGAVAGGQKREMSGRERPALMVYPGERRPWLKRAAIVLVSLLIVSLLGLLVVNYLFFEPAARLVLDKVKQRTGIEVTFGAASGNIFKGTVVLKRARLRRGHHQKSNFKLTAEEIAVDLDLMALLSLRPSLEYLRVEGLRGTFERTGKVDRQKPRRAYKIDELLVKNLEMTITDHTRGTQPIVLQVKINRLESLAFRSRMALFDILFKSSASGVVNQAPFTVEMQDSEDGCGANWTVHRLQLDRAGEYLFGDFNFIGRGSLDIEVLNRLQTAGVPAIEMQWRLVFRDIEVRGAKRLAAYIKDHAKELALEFRFRIPEQDFKDAVSLKGAGVGEKFRQLFGRTLLKLAVDKKEKIKEIGQKGMGRVKKFMGHSGTR